VYRENGITWKGIGEEIWEEKEGENLARSAVERPKSFFLS
jgi:hypothetical protein